MANVFEALAEIYEDSVKEQDENGYADAFKSATELFFKYIEEELTDPSWYDRPSITFEDVEYLDGYFIFGRGTNSVIHFHIKECPGWKFGIWWGAKQTDEKVEIIGQFFAQFEKTIDKFKPSRSEISGEISFYEADGKQLCSCFDVRNQINFIIEEPYLAFCRDYCLWDYNCEYHTREEAKAKYDKYIDDCEREEKYTAICNEKILSFVRERILPLIKDSEIEDKGGSWSPRYEVIAPHENYSDCCQDEGFFSLFEVAVIDTATNEEDLAANAQQLEDEFNAVLQECEDIAKANDVCWFHPIDKDVYLYSKKEDS